MVQLPVEMNLQVHSTCVALVVDLRSSLPTVTGQRKSRVMRSLNCPRKQKIPLPKDVAETCHDSKPRAHFPPGSYIAPSVEYLPNIATMIVRCASDVLLFLQNRGMYSTIFQTKVMPSTKRKDCGSSFPRTGEPGIPLPVSEGRTSSTFVYCPILENVERNAVIVNRFGSNQQPFDAIRDVHEVVCADGLSLSVTFPWSEHDLNPLPLATHDRARIQ